MPKLSAFEAEEQRSTQTHLLQVERSTLQELRRQGLVDDDTSRKLAESLDARLMAVRSGALDQSGLPQRRWMRGRRTSGPATRLRPCSELGSTYR